jgi:hypothetical protein
MPGPDDTTGAMIAPPRTPEQMALDASLKERLEALKRQVVSLKERAPDDAVKADGDDGVKEMRKYLSELRAENAHLRRALVSIGKNTCGHEPLAAAYARGVLSELRSTGTPE